MEKREKERLEEAVWNNLLARPDSSLLVTYALLTLNILVFIFLSTQGAGILLPNAIVSIDWGSNYRPLTLSGDWWRIGTCIFLHFGIIHLAMNMYALHEIGAYLEPLLGRTKFLAAYMSTGILASLVSLRWYQEPVNSAGASGAIFGMYGVFLMLLCTEIVPQARRKHLLPSIGAFVFYNLAHGTSSGVDNAAHIGGLFSGLFFGYFFYYSLALRQRGAEARWVTPSIILTALAFSGLYLSSHHVSADVRRKTFLELKDYRFADADTYLTLYNQFVDIQDEAIKGLKATLKNPRRQTDLKAKWEAAAKLLDKMEGLSVSENKKRKTALLKNYTALRIEEVSLWANIREHGTDDLASKKIDSLYERINKLSEEITALN
jgi:rhomboid protease GluP